MGYNTRDFSILQRVRTVTGTHPATSAVGIGQALPAAFKRPVREAKSSTEINAWNCAYTSPYVLIVYCLLRLWKKLYFTSHASFWTKTCSDGGRCGFQFAAAIGVGLKRVWCVPDGHPSNPGAFYTCVWTYSVMILKPCIPRDRQLQMQAVT
jgi:hypothetical protein